MPTAARCGSRISHASDRFVPVPAFPGREAPSIRPAIAPAIDKGAGPQHHGADAGIQGGRGDVNGGQVEFLAVDLDPILGNENFRLAPRAQSGPGQNPGDAVTLCFLVFRIGHDVCRPPAGSSWSALQEPCRSQATERTGSGNADTEQYYPPLVLYQRAMRTTSREAVLSP